MILNYPGGPNVIARFFLKWNREAEELRVREILEDAILLTLKIEEGDMS